MPDQVELVDTDNPLEEQVVTALRLLKVNMASLSRATGNNLNKDNMAHHQELRDITVLNLVNPVKDRASTDLNLNPDHHMEHLLEFLLDLDNLLKGVTDSSLRVSTVSNLDKDRDSMDSSLAGNMDNNPDKGNMVNKPYRDNTGSNLVKVNTVNNQVMGNSTVNNLLKGNTVNNQDKVKVNTVNSLLKVNMDNKLLLPVEVALMLDTSPRCYSNVSRT